MVDGRIRLDQGHVLLVDRHVTVQRGDDAAGGRAEELEAQRVADRDHQLADAELVAVTELGRGQAGRVDLEDGKVRLEVVADDLGINSS